MIPAVEETRLSQASSGFSIVSQTQPLSVEITRASSSLDSSDHDHGYTSQRRTDSRKIVGTVGVLLLCLVFSVTLYIASGSDFLGGSKVVLNKYHRKRVVRNLGWE